MKRFSIIGAALIAVALIVMIIATEERVPEQIADGVLGIGQSIVPVAEEAQNEEYGIQPEEDLYICTDVIRPNENLSEILSRNGIPYQVIHELAEKSRDVMDVRKLKAGKSYCIMRERDSLEQVQYFIYEEDPVNYVVYEIGDSVTVRKGKKEVQMRERVASGVIQSSLWNTLTENSLDPELAIRMSEIYAWSIDFYRLQKGDQFKVLLEEKYVEGERVGIGSVRGAVFHHSGKDNYAIYYAQDSVADFFDENANSLRKAFLKAPLQFRRISSQFNRRRFHPILKRRRPHLGTDYAAATGTPIWAIGDGVVQKATRNRGSGKYVEIRHNGTYTTRYLHMSKHGEGIKAGVHVKQGQVIGYVGSTGLATGPHLHFEMIKNGQHVNSMHEELPPGDPVPEACKEAFMIYRDQIKSELDAIPAPEALPSAEAGPA